MYIQNPSAIGNPDQTPFLAGLDDDRRRAVEMNARIIAAQPSDASAAIVFLDTETETTGVSAGDEIWVTGS
jgi:hypothetical protein